jgi:hypothetical protein
VFRGIFVLDKLRHGRETNLAKRDAKMRGGFIFRDEGNFKTSPLFGLDAFDLFNQCDHKQQTTK